MKPNLTTMLSFAMLLFYYGYKSPVDGTVNDEGIVELDPRAYQLDIDGKKTILFKRSNLGGMGAWIGRKAFGGFPKLLSLIEKFRDMGYWTDQLNGMLYFKKEIDLYQAMDSAASLTIWSTGFPMVKHKKNDLNIIFTANSRI